QPLDEPHQPLQPRGNFIRARWDATSCKPQLPVDRGDRCTIGEAGHIQAVLALKLHHRRHRVGSGDAVLGQPGVGAKLVERLLHPQGSVRRLLVSLEWDGHHPAIAANPASNSLGWRTTSCRSLTFKDSAARSSCCHCDCWSWRSGSIRTATWATY